MKEPNVYKYTWQLPHGTKRFQGIAHGNTWADALSHILEYHPKRTNIQWVRSFEMCSLNEHPNVEDE